MIGGAAASTCPRSYQAIRRAERVTFALKGEFAGRDRASFEKCPRWLGRCERRRPSRPFLRVFLGQRRVHPDAGKVDELVAQLRGFRPPGQADAFARIVVVFLGFRQHGHQPAVDALQASIETQLAEGVGPIRDSWAMKKVSRDVSNGGMGPSPSDAAARYEGTPFGTHRCAAR